MTPDGTDCGFYSGDKVHRGYFNGANAASVSITALGGLAFSWSASLNGPPIGGNLAKDQAGCWLRSRLFLSWLSAVGLRQEVDDLEPCWLLK
ncbi:glycosyl hydrolase family 35 [Colletotrichum asianum]